MQSPLGAARATLEGHRCEFEEATGLLVIISMHPIFRDKRCSMEYVRYIHDAAYFREMEREADAGALNAVDKMHAMST